MGRIVHAFILTLKSRSTVKCEVLDKSTEIKVKPGIRYFLSDKLASEQSVLGAICAQIISFFFVGIAPLLIILFFVGWMFPRAGRYHFFFIMMTRHFYYFLLNIIDPCKGV